MQLIYKMMRMNKCNKTIKFKNLNQESSRMTKRKMINNQITKNVPLAKLKLNNNKTQIKPNNIKSKIIINEMIFPNNNSNNNNNHKTKSKNTILKTKENS